MLGFVLKLVMARARPSFDTPTATAPGFSFPSGHAFVSAFAVFVFLLVIRPALPGTPARVAAGSRRLIVFISDSSGCAGFTTAPMCPPGGWSRPCCRAFETWRRDAGRRPPDTIEGVEPDKAGG